MAEYLSSQKLSDPSAYIEQQARAYYYARRARQKLEEARGLASATDPAYSNCLRDLALVASFEGRILANLKRFDEAKVPMERSIELYQQLIELEPDRVAHSINLIRVLNTYGDMLLVNLNDFELSRKQYSAAILKVRELRSDPVLNELESDGLAKGYYRLGLAALAWAIRLKPKLLRTLRVDPRTDASTSTGFGEGAKEPRAGPGSAARTDSSAGAERKH